MNLVVAFVEFFRIYTTLLVGLIGMVNPALLFESSQVLLNPILLGLSVRAKAIVIQNGN